jgi:hypothetical protein
VSAQVWKAIKTMNRKLRAGNVQKEWTKRKWFTPPAQQRVLDAKETALRLARKKFKAQMAAIATRQKQCAPEYLMCMCLTFHAWQMPFLPACLYACISAGKQVGTY